MLAHMAKAVELRPSYPPNFVNKLDSVSDNGWYFNDIYLPLELITHILTYLNGKSLLKASLVCRNWFNLVRSNTIWYKKYKRLTNKKPKKVPWYVYYAYFNHRLFNRNLIKNGNGQNELEHWKIMRCAGSRIRVEFPGGAFALPTDVDDFNGKKSCFVVSQEMCIMVQAIDLAPLCRYVLDTHKPHIYVSEWVASSYKCFYRLGCNLEPIDNKVGFRLAQKCTGLKIRDTEGRNWSKVDMVLSDYPDGVGRIWFTRLSRNLDKDFNLKMAGASVKILFDTIKEVTN